MKEPDPYIEFLETSVEEELKSEGSAYEEYDKLKDDYDDPNSEYID